MIPQPPTLSQSAQADAVRENFRRLNDWLDTFRRGGVNWTELKGTPATLAGYGITAVSWNVLTSVPSTFTPAAHTHVINDISNAGAMGKTLLATADAAAARTALGITSISLLGTTVFVPVS